MLRRKCQQRREKKWVQFVKQVEHVQDSKRGTLTQVFNDQASTGVISPLTAQGWCTATLYGGAGTATSAHVGVGDVSTIVSTMGSQGTYNVGNGTRFNFFSAVMDLTIKNPASEWLGDQTMEVDVYDLVYWRGDSPDWGNPGLALVTTDTLALGTGSVTSLTQRGVTPFDVPMFIRNMRCNILKKTKYLIPQNGNVTYQIRLPRNFSITPRDLDGGDFRFKNCRSVLVIAKPVDTGNDSQNLFLGATRSYHFTIANVNTTDRSQYNT